MTSLDLKKIKVEAARVYAARVELELRMDERQEEIERIKGQISIQLEKEKELKEKIDSESQK